MLGVTLLLQCLQNNRINAQWYICTCSELKRGQCHTAVDARLACLDAMQQWLGGAEKE